MKINERKKTRRNPHVCSCLRARGLSLFFGVKQLNMCISTNHETYENVCIY